MALLGQKVQYFLGITGDGLVTDHIREVVDTIQFLCRLVQAIGNVILQLFRHPYNALDTAFCADELLRCDKVTAMSHEAGGLYTAAGHGGQLTESHTGRSHALVLTVYDNDTVGSRLYAADALEATAAGHRIFDQGIQSYLIYSALCCLLNDLVDFRISAGAFIRASDLLDRAGRGQWESAPS